MKTIQKTLIIGVTCWLMLIAILMYCCYTNDKFRTILENYHFPESHVPAEALGISVIKN